MKTVVFANQKGGVGKSVLADELAFEMERSGIEYALYDLDGQGGLLHSPSENPKAKVSIIDTPGQLTGGVLDAIKIADVIVVPTRAAQKEMEPLQRTFEVVKKTKKKGATVIIVLNGWNRHTTYSLFEEWLKNEYPEFDRIVTVPQAEAFAQAEMLSMSVIDQSPRSAVSEQLKKLWTVIKYELKFNL